MVSADLLVLLSDVDGLYDAPPDTNAAARHIPCVARITPEIEAMAGARRLGTFARRHADQDRSGEDRHQCRHAHGHRLGPASIIRCVPSPRARACTWFLTAANPVTARKKWIAGALEPKGTLVIDAGAVAALRRGKSLLPAGVVTIDGGFARGDAVVIRGPNGAEIARGLCAYDVEDAQKIRGRSSADIASILGFGGRAEMVHRDDLVVGPE